MKSLLINIVLIMDAVQSFKYFLDMAPEESVINPSSLTKFRKLRLKDMSLLNMPAAKTVRITGKQL